jgi:ribosome biogenesis SPOUT family RNA methylase Rps3
MTGSEPGATREQLRELLATLRRPGGAEAVRAALSPLPLEEAKLILLDAVAEAALCEDDEARRAVWGVVSALSDEAREGAQ